MRAAAMILAAGLGTRLRPLTDERAKPLVPIGDEPLLARVARRLAAAGAERAVVNVHHRAGDFEPAREALALPLVVSRERELLGTAGGIAAARPHFGGRDVLVWNGDIDAEIDVGALADARASSGAIAALAVAPAPRGAGAVGLGEGGRVVRLRDVRRGDEIAGGTYVGVAALGAAFVASLPARGCLVGDALGPALAAGALVAAVPHLGPFFDVGSPAGYLGANLAWLGRRGGAAFVGAGAEVGPAVRLVRSIVGAGARVDGDGELIDCVLWPGARAAAPLGRTVVTAGGLRLVAPG